LKQARTALLFGVYSIVLFVVAGCSGAPLTGKIAYTSGFGKDGEIYIMNADGSNPVRLTNNAAYDYGPAFSPDGKQIAFASNRDGNYAVYVMSSDGSNSKRLARNAGLNTSPAWSPDGKRIAYTTQAEGNRGEIWVMNVDGSNQTRLTSNSAADTGPAWSPDGKRIVFSSDRDGEANLYTMNADGSAVAPLSDNPNMGAATHPVWSSDGKQIAFDMYQDIWVIGADGKNLRCLTCADHTRCERPVWSPDGKFLAFASSQDSMLEIYVMNADGTNSRRLTNNKIRETDPAWTR
jgi:Tol biopolymer transport system component